MIGRMHKLDSRCFNHEGLEKFSLMWVKDWRMRRLFQFGKKENENEKEKDKVEIQ